MIHDYLPMNRAEMNIRGWNQCDFVYVSGDAYVDHPSFGHAIITRLLEAHGYRVGIIAQPEVLKGAVPVSCQRPVKGGSGACGGQGVKPYGQTAE